MQIETASRNYKMLGFQLPSLHKTIPKKAILRERAGSLAQMALNLINAGVINPADVPDNVISPADVVKHGVEPWFEKRTSGLTYLHFSFAMIDAEKARSAIEGESENTREFGVNPVLGVYSSMQEHSYSFEACAQELEPIKRGLIGSVLKAIRRASTLTVDIHDPMEMLDQFAMHYWDGDTNISAKDARDIILDRVGPDGDIAGHLPRAVKPIYGHELWRHDRPRNKMQAPQLRAFAKSTSHSKAKRIAEEAAVLLELCDEADLKEACLPSLDGIDLRPFYRACHLVYSNHQYVWADRDSEFQHAMECSSGTDALGFHELPSGCDALALYFNKLDLALRVTCQMDKVIGLIAEPISPNYGDENEF